MSLKFKFKLIGALLIISFLLNLIGLYYTHLETDKMRRKDMVNSELIKTSSDLRFLTFEYLSAPLRRNELQIIAKSEEVSALLTVYERCDHCYDYFEEIKKQNLMLIDTYQDLFDHATTAQLPLPEQALRREMLAGQIQVNSQMFMRNLMELNDHNRERLIAAQRRENIFSFTTLCVMFLLFGIILFYIYRNMFESLEKIRIAANFSAAKNFKEGTIDLKSNDEIGQVAKAFNRMIEEISSTYHALEEEIALRKKAEAELIDINKTLEMRIMERTRRLEEKNQELERFTYSVSHDLKAPLRGIDGYSRLLLEDHLQTLDDEGRLFLQNIRYAVEQMGQLIDDLLAYSRLERKPWQSDHVNIKRMVESIAHEYMSVFQEHDGKLNIDVPDLEVTIEQEGLGLVLRNLLDNALKFSHSECTPEITIAGEQKDDRVLLWVKDNGIGFDMVYHDRIFGIFNRLHRAEDYPGTGIGLAIVRKAMERMNSSVWAESSPGQGSTFYLEIPLYETE